MDADRTRFAPSERLRCQYAPAAARSNNSKHGKYRFFTKKRESLPTGQNGSVEGIAATERSVP